MDKNSNELQKEFANAGEISPNILARIGGFLYLIIIGGGIIGELFVRESFIVSGNAIATAQKLLESPFLWRVHVANEFFMLICTTVLMLILYRLLKPVNKNLALLAVFFNIISIVIEAGNELNLLSALRLLSNAEYLRVFHPDQLYSLAYLPLQAYASGFGAGLIFFGCECIILGYLIFKSGYLPKAIGILMWIAGLSYLINSFTLIISTSLSTQLIPLILIPAFIGELSFCLWLLIKGVNHIRHGN